MKRYEQVAHALSQHIEQELYRAGDRLPSIRALCREFFDDDGRVLLCSGFSKMLAPGRYRDQAMHMKYVSTDASATLPQLAVAEFIAKGHYERHLRDMQRQYQRQRDILIDWVERYFPADIGISYPQGGFLLWVELPGPVDCLRLNERLA